MKFQNIIDALLFMSVIYLMDGGTRLASANADNFYGSPVVLDGYLENKEKYVQMFTIPVNSLNLNGNSSDIEHSLKTKNTTGKN